MLDSNPYLEQEVLTASPARLKWLLLRKGVDLCQVVEQLWAQNQDSIAKQWTIRLRDILGELLAGVSGQDPLSRKVADLYVFSLKLLTTIELERNVSKLRQLRRILEIEEETWQLVQRQSAIKCTHASASSIQRAPVVPPTSAFTGGESFSLEV